MKIFYGDAEFTATLIEYETLPSSFELVLTGLDPNDITEIFLPWCNSNRRMDIPFRSNDLLIGSTFGTLRATSVRAIDFKTNDVILTFDCADDKL